MLNVYTNKLDSLFGSPTRHDNENDCFVNRKKPWTLVALQKFKEIQLWLQICLQQDHQDFTATGMPVAVTCDHRCL